MAQMLIIAAINIGASILINQFLGPEGQDIEQEGPRLGDLSVSSSAYGETINIGYGTNRTGGEVIWSPGLREVANTVEQEGGGKGGQGGGSVTQTTYSYFMSVAVAISEGEISDVTRIWADSKLVYDATKQDASQGKFPFRLYKGTDTQQPDSAIAADRGAANAPAFRGLAYVVFEDMPLADFGNRLPNFSFEVAFSTQDAFPRTDLTDPGGIMDGVGSTAGDDDGEIFLDPRTDIIYHLEEGSSEPGFSRAQASSLTALSGQPGSFGLSDSPSSHIAMDGKYFTIPGSGNFATYRKIDPVTGQLIYQLPNSVGNAIPNRIAQLQTVLPAVGPVSIVVLCESDQLFGTRRMRFYRENDDGDDVTLMSTTSEFNEDNDWGVFVVDIFNGRLFLVAESTTDKKVYEIVPQINVGFLGPELGTPEVELRATLTHGVDIGSERTSGFCVLPDEQAFILGNGTSMVKIDMDSGAVLAKRLDLGFRAKNNWSDNGFFAFRGLGPAVTEPNDVVYTIGTNDLSTFNVQDIRDFFQTVPDAEPANISDRMTAYDPRNNSLVFVRQTSSPGAGPDPAMSRIFINRASGLGADLQSVVTNLCLRAGLEASEFDATALAGQTVNGIVFNNQGSVRSALEALTEAYLFEGVESDAKIKFVTRGGGSVATVQEQYVGILGSGNDQDRFKQLAIQEVELPARFTVRYADKDREYQQGAQSDKRTLAPFRIVQTEEEKTLDLPMVMDAETARRLAQRWLYTIWAERRSVETDIPWRFIALDPTDVFELEAPRSKGQAETLLLRGGTLETGADLTIKMRAAVQDARSNDSALATDVGESVAPVVANTLPSIFHGLNLPLLSASDATFQQFSRGYYAMSGQGSNWPGALLFRSRDGGLTFTEVGASSSEAAYGQTTETLADPVTTTEWDPAGSLTLAISAGKDQFENKTELEVLNGANALAVIKANGDTEIIQFRDVTDNGGGSITVSYLLRGRKGTDAVASGHGPAEKVVLLKRGAILVTNVELPDLNTTLRYTPTTLGTLIESNFPVDFAYKGVDLLPYAPAHPAAVDNAGNIDLSWTRRTRFNGELRDGTGEVPLNEASESYEVDVVKASTVLRTIAVTSEAATYTSAQQSTDGVVSTDTITFRVYQLSGVVGRGREASVDYVVP